MKKKIILPLIAVIVLAGGLALASPLVARLIIKGGINYMNKKEEQEKEELVKIAESKEAKMSFEETLKNIDPQALTPQGKIKTYRIDKKSLKHHPMGGVMVTLILNNDVKIALDVVLVQDARTNEYEISNSGWSKGLVDLMEG